MKTFTLEDLKSRAWYRFIKVIYIIIFSLILLISSLITYSINSPRQVDDYLVKCNYGNKISFLAWGDKSIYISDYDLKNGLSSIPNSTKSDLESTCQISQTDINNLANSIYNQKNVLPLYTISKTTTVKGSFNQTIFNLLLDILIIAIIFETFRRVFYYIVLGKFDPNNFYRNLFKKRNT